MFVLQGDKMDLGSESSEEEDVEEFRYDMDIDEHRFLVPCFILLSPPLLLSVITIVIVFIMVIIHHCCHAALSLFLLIL